MYTLWHNSTVSWLVWNSFISPHFLGYFMEVQFIMIKKPKSTMRSKWANIVLFLNRPNFPFTRLSLHISAPPIPPSPALYLIIFVRPKCYRGWIIHPGTESEKRAGNFVNRVTGEWCLTHLHYNIWPWKQKLIELNLQMENENIM